MFLQAVVFQAEHQRSARPDEDSSCIRGCEEGRERLGVCLRLLSLYEREFRELEAPGGSPLFSKLHSLCNSHLSRSVNKAQWYKTQEQALLDLVNYSSFKLIFPALNLCKAKHDSIPEEQEIFRTFPISSQTTDKLWASPLTSTCSDTPSGP